MSSKAGIDWRNLGNGAGEFDRHVGLSTGRHARSSVADSPNVMKV
ncbi:hypothetical protein ACXR0O_12530 [Verrucomicrobiota bacterium sgz303538]